MDRQMLANQLDIAIDKNQKTAIVIECSSGSVYIIVDKDQKTVVVTETTRRTWRRMRI